MIDASSSLIDVAFAVGTCLDAAGVRVVLCGGAAAVYHAPEVLQSYDLDFVALLGARQDDVEEALAGLGFRHARDHFEHESTPYIIEFVGDQILIGDTSIETWVTARDDRGELRVLSGTDCCRDRLAAFYHFGDRSALAQALAVARATEVDLDVIATWSRGEGHEERCAEFLRRASPR